MQTRDTLSKTLQTRLVDLVSTIIRILGHLELVELKVPRAFKASFLGFSFLWFFMVRTRSSDLVRIFKKDKR